MRTGTPEAPIEPFSAPRLATPGDSPRPEDGSAPIPGTDLFDDMKEGGRILVEDLLAMTPSKPSLEHPNMTTEELGAIYWELYDRLYTIRRILGRTIFQKYFIRDPGRYLFYLVLNLFYRYEVKRRIGLIVM